MITIRVVHALLPGNGVKVIKLQDGISTYGELIQVIEQAMPQDFEWKTGYNLNLTAQNIQLFSEENPDSNITVDDYTFNNIEKSPNSIRPLPLSFVAVDEDDISTVINNTEFKIFCNQAKGDHGDLSEEDLKAWSDLRASIKNEVNSLTKVKEVTVRDNPNKFEASIPTPTAKKSKFNFVVEEE